jgi:hypothetical protein
MTLTRNEAANMMLNTALTNNKIKSDVRKLDPMISRDQLFMQQEQEMAEKGDKFIPKNYVRNASLANAVERSIREHKMEKSAFKFVNKLREAEQDKIRKQVKLVQEKDKIEDKVRKERRISPMDQAKYAMIILQMEKPARELSPFDTNILEDITKSNLFDARLRAIVDDYLRGKQIRTPITSPTAVPGVASSAQQNPSEDAIIQQAEEEYRKKEEEAARLKQQSDKLLSQQNQKLDQDIADIQDHLDQHNVPPKERPPNNPTTNNNAKKLVNTIAKIYNVSKNGEAYKHLRSNVESSIKNQITKIVWGNQNKVYNYWNDLYKPLISEWESPPPNSVIETAVKTLHSFKERDKAAEKARRAKKAKEAREAKKSGNGYFINEGYIPNASPLLHLMATNGLTERLVNEYKAIEEKIPMMDGINKMKANQQLERLRREIEKNYYLNYGEDPIIRMEKGVVYPGYVEGTFNVGDYIYGVPGGNTRYDYPYLYRNWGGSNWLSTMEQPIRIGSVFDHQTYIDHEPHVVGDIRYTPRPKCYAYIGNSLFEKPENPDDYYEYAYDTTDTESEELDESEREDEIEEFED